MLKPQVVVNLLPELAVRTDVGRHGDDSNAARDSSRQLLFRMVGGRSSRDGTECPRDCTPSKCMQMPAVRTTLGHVDCFTALMFKQHSKQSALRKGQRRFFHRDHN
jgi:hypothetical protein